MRRPTYLITGLIVTGALAFGGFAGSTLADAVGRAESRRARALDRSSEAAPASTAPATGTSTPTATAPGAGGPNAPSGGGAPRPAPDPADASHEPAPGAVGSEPAGEGPQAPDLGPVGRPEGLPPAIAEPVQWISLGGAIASRTAPPPCRPAESLVEAVVNQPERVRLAWVTMSYGDHQARIDAAKVDGRLRAVLVFVTGGAQPGAWVSGSYTWFAALEDGSVVRSAAIPVSVLNGGCLLPVG